jgi:hypothetical protein
MTQTISAATGGTLTNRGGSSRKLLMRKALEGARMPVGDALEDVFPKHAGEAQPNASALVPPGEQPTDQPIPATAAGDEQAATAVFAPEAVPAVEASASATAVKSAPSEPLAPDQHQPAAPAATWSDEDEATFQSMTARRKAAGYQRRGREVGGQLLRVGDIAPNPGTVVAAIVGIVAERGTLTRSELLDAMAGTTFPNAKAKPDDRGWCQGYVAGAVRDGFLAAAAGPEANSSEVTL